MSEEALKCSEKEQGFAAVKANEQHLHQEPQEAYRKAMAEKLNDAVKKNNIQVVQQLLEEGADINAKVDKGWTPLHSAVQGDYEEIVELLLDKGADPLVKKGDGATPFILAGITGNVNLLKTFLEKGSDINECGINGFTAFMEAAVYGQERALRFLFNKGANVNLGREVDESKKAVKKGGATALMDAARHGHITLVKILVKEMDADVNICDNRDTNALIHALSVAEDKGWDRNKEEAALFLLESGSVVNKRDEKGKTALLLAVERGSLNLVTALLKTDVIDINDADENNRTALEVAVEKKNCEIAKLLCEKGADVYDHLLDIACRNYNNEMRNLLCNYPSSPRPVQPETSKEFSSTNWREKLEKLEKMYRPMIGKLKIFPYQDLMIQKTTQGGVYLGIYDGEEVAVKIFRKGAENAEQEKNCLEKCRKSSHLVKFYGWEERKCSLYLCLTLCERNLQEYFSEPQNGMMESKRILETIFQAVMKLHAVGFGHQELHPSNILIDVNKKIFLADFDKSRKITDDNKDVIISEDLQGLQKLVQYVVMRGKKDFKDLPVQCTEELDDYMEIEDLQTRLKSPKSNRHISAVLGQLIHHPYFWCNEKKYRVLRDIGNEHDIKHRDNNSELLKALKSDDPFTDWKEKIDKDVFDCMVNFFPDNKGKKKEARKSKTYKPDVIDLLKFIRNMGEHYNEKTDRVKSIIKDPAEYFLNLFPHLTIYIYKCLCNTEYNRHFNIASHP